MKIWLLLLGLVGGPCLFSNDLLTKKISTDPLFQECYQDIVLHNKVVKEGSDICDTRYALLRPILDGLHRPFSLLDIGAAEGYFSFKIAEEYPQSIVYALEGGSGLCRYLSAPDRLYALCQANSHLTNLNFLRHLFTFHSLQELNRNEHFDVVLAFLVVHFMAYNGEYPKEYMKNAQRTLQALLDLGDNVIIELSWPDNHPELISYVEELCKKSNGRFIGQVVRRKTNNGNNIGKLYWFNNSSQTHNLGIHLSTFYSYGGQWPTKQEIDQLSTAFPLNNHDELIIQGKKISVAQSIPHNTK